jgi:hypothetical protein
MQHLDASATINHMSHLGRLREIRDEMDTAAAILDRAGPIHAFDRPRLQRSMTASDDVDGSPTPPAA